MMEQMRSVIDTTHTLFLSRQRCKCVHQGFSTRMNAPFDLEPNVLGSHRPELSREGEPPCEPNLFHGSDGASPSLKTMRGTGSRISHMEGDGLRLRLWAVSFRDLEARAMGWRSDHGVALAADMSLSPAALRPVGPGLAGDRIREEPAALRGGFALAAGAGLAGLAG